MRKWHFREGGSIPPGSTLRSLLTQRATRGTATIFYQVDNFVKSGVCPSKLRGAKWDNMFYVYILQLKDKTFYIGYSANLKQRIKEHERGIVESTKNLRPSKLIFYAAFSSKMKAFNFEKYLKSGSGFAFRNKRLI